MLAGLGGGLRLLLRRLLGVVGWESTSSFNKRIILSDFSWRLLAGGEDGSESDAHNACFRRALEPDIEHQTQTTLLSKNGYGLLILLFLLLLLFLLPLLLLFLGCCCFSR